MARKPLSPEQKRAMQKARRKTQEETNAALEALATNPQFTNFKLWKRIDPALQDAVKKAITKAGKAAKIARIRKLENEIEKIRNEM